MVLTKYECFPEDFRLGLVCYFVEEIRCSSSISKSKTEY